MPDTPEPLTRSDLARLLRKARALAPHRAEDLVQDTCLSILTRLENGQIRNPSAYANVTLRYLARRPRKAIDGPDPDEISAPETCHLAVADVATALATLPETYRALLLDCLAGHAYAEIAERHALPLGTVTSRIARARAALRKVLDLPKDRAVDTLIDAERVGPMSR